MRRQLSYSFAALVALGEPSRGLVRGLRVVLGDDFGVPPSAEDRRRLGADVGGVAFAIPGGISSGGVSAVPLTVVAATSGAEAGAAGAGTIGAGTI
jgi:hypothetical protein